MAKSLRRLLRTRDFHCEVRFGEAPRLQTRFVAIDISREENSVVHMEIVEKTLTAVFDCVARSKIMAANKWESCLLAITGTNGHCYHDFTRCVEFECDLLAILALHRVRVELAVIPCGDDERDEVPDVVGKLGK